jgi:hypothetical protein
VIIANEMIAGSIWDLLQIEYVRAVFAHLGYPLYLLTILGVWKLPCGVVMLLPRLLRLKEWAYAGAVFNYSGAAASHLLVGDPPGKWLGPAILCLITLVSWAMRPPGRRLASAVSEDATRPIDWVVPAVVAALMLVLAFLTLPKGPNPW